MLTKTRDITINEPKHHFAEGAIELSAGLTKILATASVTEGVPRFLRESRQGWLTAEYNMLPRATHTRTDRDINRGKISARTSEIQRLIGRSLRSCIQLRSISEHTIIIDCDVLQADGSTRCHAINAGQIALVRAIQKMQLSNKIKTDPLKFLIAAVSAGFVNGKAVIDLNYQQDHKADLDMNIVMSEHGDLIEIQGTAEKKPFSRDQLNQLLDLAWPEIEKIIKLQQAILQTPYPYDNG